MSYFSIYRESLFPFLNLSPSLAEEYQFLSQELKQLAKRIDGIFLPKKTELPIYFLEVQFQKDDSLYYRLFTEIFTYLGQYKPPQDFQAIVIWEKKNLENPLPNCYQFIQKSGKLTIIYLDEWNFENNQIFGLEIIKLITLDEAEAINQANQLLNFANNKDMIELLEKVLVYKFSNYTREELDKMFTLSDFKKTRFYQDTFSEGKIEGKIEVIPDLIKLGLTVEQIATALKLDLELVKKIANYNY